jgi:hypothetical protein
MKLNAALAIVRTRPTGYRGKMIESGEAPIKCRSGSRHLYVDEFGSVYWCAHTRGVFSKDLLAYTYADLREQFDTPKNCSTRWSAVILRRLGKPLHCSRIQSSSHCWESSDE